MKTPTQQIVKHAMEIALRDVRQPKCVRDGLVFKKENKMSKIPTAEEFAWSQEQDFKTMLLEQDYQGVYKLMIDFAKLHAEAALFAANNNAVAKQDHSDFGTGDIWVDSDSILNSYPLSKIQ
jgi:hypothetical protein